MEPIQAVKKNMGRLLGQLVDPTIFLSFDRAGYLIHKLAFNPSDLEVDMTGKICLVTGANSGIGYEVALNLASRGASIYLLCRNEKKAERAAHGIRVQTEKRKIHVKIVDLSDLESIRQFVEQFDETHVDVLINNAGIYCKNFQKTKDGIEQTWATNVLGPFLLTKRLLPKLMASKNGRVINVSSGGLYMQKLKTDDLNWQKRPFDGMKAYCQTKRALVVLSEILSERVAGTGVTVNSMHPGWVDTPLVRENLPLFWKAWRYDLRGPEEGADTIIWLASCDRIEHETGQFWFDRKPRRTHYLPITKESFEARQNLWELCCQMSRKYDISTCD